MHYLVELAVRFGVHNTGFFVVSLSKRSHLSIHSEVVRLTAQVSISVHLSDPLS